MSLVSQFPEAKYCNPEFRSLPRAR